MTTWLVIVAVGAGSYIFRALPVFLQRRLARTSRFDEIVAPAGTAALAALAAAGLQRGATTTTATAGMAVAGGGRAGWSPCGAAPWSTCCSPARSPTPACLAPPGWWPDVRRTRWRPA